MKRRVLKDEAVSPVIATILMVAITVVLAATLYMMLPKGGGGGDQQSGQFASKEKVTNNDWKVTFSKLNPERGISELTFRLDTPNGADTGEFNDNGDGQTLVLDDETNTFQLNYTDLVDNNIINQGDSVTIAGGDATAGWAVMPAGSYTLTMLYDGATVDDISWTVV